jgi:hypothetical protein
MRIFLVSITSLLFITSCSKYQCVSISSDDTDRNEKNEFFIDNDSLRVTFNFYDRRGTVHVSIFNKTTEIFGVNWAKSFVIVNESPSSFFNPEVQVQGELDKTQTANSHLIKLSATAVQLQAIQYIPPQTAVSHAGLALTQGGFLDNDKYQFKKESMKVLDVPRRIKRANIEKSNSPLRFRIYLTLVPEGSAGANPIILERSFYASGLINTSDEASVIFPGNQNGNMIIMKKSTTAGVILKTTVTIGLLTLVCAAAGG